MAYAMARAALAGFSVVALFAGLSPASGATPDATLKSTCQAYLDAPAAQLGDAAQHTALGDCALVVGDADAAIIHYGKAVALAPEVLAVRLQLVQVLMAVGRADEAKRYLAAAARSNPGDPAAVRMAALAKLPVMNAEAGMGSWRGGVTLARRYDSNINSGSSASTFDILIAGTLVELSLSDDSKGQPGWATVLGGGASYLHVLGDGNAVVFRGDIAATIYDQHTDYNGIEASAGIGFIHAGNGMIWSVTPNARLAWENGRLDQAGVYVDGRASLALTDQLGLNGFGKIGFTSAGTNPDLDSWNFIAGSGLDYALSDTVTLGALLVVERKSATSAVQSFTKFGPKFYLTAALAEGLTADVSYAYSKAIFDETLPIFPAARADDHHEISAGLTFDLSRWTEGLSLDARYSYRHVNSTVPFYASDRHAITTSLNYAF